MVMDVLVTAILSPDKFFPLETRMDPELAKNCNPAGAVMVIVLAVPTEKSAFCVSEIIKLPNVK
jgi:hypothetical protein